MTEETLRQVREQPEGTILTIGLITGMPADEGVVVRKIANDQWVILFIDNSRHSKFRDDKGVATLLDLYDHPWGFS